MLVEMPYGIIEINSKEEAIDFIKNRCNKCPHSEQLWSCSGYQAELCDKKEQEILKLLKNGWKEIL